LELTDDAMPEPILDTRPAFLIWDPAATAHARALAADLALSAIAVFMLGQADPADSSGARGSAPPTSVRMLPGERKGAALVRAAAEARGAGATHLIWVDAGRLPPLQAVHAMRRAAATQPRGLLVGRWTDPAPGTANHRRALQRRWARFWLKIQTGQSVHDLFSGLRAYPLYVLDHLRLRQRGSAVDIEIMVKALWAGVDVAEVALGPAPREPLPQASLQDPDWRSTLYRLALNIHYAMRAITPLPHRKLVADGRQPGQVVSVLHPWRSLRTLLRENITPGRLAASGALGVFLGTLPLIACHTVVTLFAANYFRLNKVAALSTSQLCMPPLVPALCIEAGYFMRHGKFLTEISLETLGYQAPARLLEWLLGSLVLAPVLALVTGGTILAMVAAISRAKRTPEPDNKGR
jgi:uncharacterized protein (DUF2062 family)